MTPRKPLYFTCSVFLAALALGWAGTAAAHDFPATGQTRCWNSSGKRIACAGTGQDGEIQAGRTLRYKDKGDGTIEDQNTDLVWEKKSDDDSIHDKDITYTWEDAFAVHMVTLNNTCAKDEMVDCSLNGDAGCAAAGVGGKCGFAGKRDWRVPNYKELTSILNFKNFNPAVSPVFNTNCVGSTVLTGSCTAASSYWSSTNFAFFPYVAWYVSFGHGFVSIDDKDGTIDPYYVRAVRGGSP